MDKIGTLYERGEFMEEKVEIYITNAKCRMEKGKRILLTYKQPNMLPCTAEESEDGCTFVFETKGMTRFGHIVDLDTVDQYRLLANCAELEVSAKRYSFSMAPDNLVYDRNLCPYILMRDQKDKDEDSFFEQYKALAAAVLSEKYRFVDFYEGGNGLYEKLPKLKDLQQKKNTEELFQYLLAGFHKEEQETKRKSVRVKKSSLLAMKIALPLMGATLATLAVYAAFFQRNKVMFQDRILRAYSYYLHSEYVKVGDELKSIPLEKLNGDVQYILARSHIFSEGLTPKQRETILSGIALNTDQTVLRYWIEIGRGEFSQAVDTAKRLGNDELLLFAYIKQSAYVMEDASISGEEKARVRESLESDIEKMSESMAEEKAKLGETAVGETTNSGETTSSGESANSANNPASDASIETSDGQGE